LEHSGFSVVWVLLKRGANLSSAETRKHFEKAIDTWIASQLSNRRCAAILLIISDSIVIAAAVQTAPKMRPRFPEKMLVGKVRDERVESLSATLCFQHLHEMAKKFFLSANLTNFKFDEQGHNCRLEGVVCHEWNARDFRQVAKLDDFETAEGARNTRR
jgi:hypothetical protein